MNSLLQTDTKKCNQDKSYQCTDPLLISFETMTNDLSKTALKKPSLMPKTNIREMFILEEVEQDEPQLLSYFKDSENDFNPKKGKSCLMKNSIRTKKKNTHVLAEVGNLNNTFSKEDSIFSGKESKLNKTFEFFESNTNKLDTSLDTHTEKKLSGSDDSLGIIPSLLDEFGSCSDLLSFDLPVKKVEQSEYAPIAEDIPICPSSPILLPKRFSDDICVSINRKQPKYASTPKSKICDTYFDIYAHLGKTEHFLSESSLSPVTVLSENYFNPLLNESYNLNEQEEFNKNNTYECVNVPYQNKSPSEYNTNLTSIITYSTSAADSAAGMKFHASKTEFSDVTEESNENETVIKNQNETKNSYVENLNSTIVYPLTLRQDTGYIKKSIKEEPFIVQQNKDENSILLVELSSNEHNSDIKTVEYENKNSHFNSTITFSTSAEDKKDTLNNSESPKSCLYVCKEKCLEPVNVIDLNATFNLDCPIIGSESMKITLSKEISHETDCYSRKSYDSADSANVKSNDSLQSLSHHEVLLSDAETVETMNNTFEKTFSLGNPDKYSVENLEMDIGEVQNFSLDDISSGSKKLFKADMLLKKQKDLIKKPALCLPEESVFKKPARYNFCLPVKHKSCTSKLVKKQLNSSLLNQTVCLTEGSTNCLGKESKDCRTTGNKSTVSDLSAWSSSSKRSSTGLQRCLNSSLKTKQPLLKSKSAHSEEAKAMDFNKVVCLTESMGPRSKYVNRSYYSNSINKSLSTSNQNIECKEILTTTDNKSVLVGRKNSSKICLNSTFDVGNKSNKISRNSLVPKQRHSISHTVSDPSISSNLPLKNKKSDVKRMLSIPVSEKESFNKKTSRCDSNISKFENVISTRISNVKSEIQTVNERKKIHQGVEVATKVEVKSSLVQAKKLPSRVSVNTTQEVYQSKLGNLAASCRPKVSHPASKLQTDQSATLNRKLGHRSIAAFQRCNNQEIVKKDKNSFLPLKEMVGQSVCNVNATSSSAALQNNS
ncbi:hypothetical protein X975_15509, partial [Stegodyphus mimosarum]